VVGCDPGEKTVRRYWIPKEALVGEEVRLIGDVLHHIRDVCRMHMGSKFEVIVEGGRALLVEITTEAKHESRARIIEERTIVELPRPHLHLAMAVPRFPVFEAVVEKAVELGVKSVRPLFSDFSFIRKQESMFDKKRARFEKIVVSATQQSGRGDLMKIEDPEPLDEFLSAFNRGTDLKGLFAYEGEGVLTAQQGIQQIQSGAKVNDVWIFVGAEGGFSDREVQLFQTVGLKPVTLGSQVLRVETACVALVSIIKYGFDLMR
jgi:16S rRNA (uracil1498-N3)-methyltransferase